MTSAPKTTRCQRPSDDLPTLGSQLRQALEELTDDDDGPHSRDFRRFIRRAMAKAWRAAAIGDLKIVAEVIEVFREARPMVDDALPKLSPRGWAAVEMQQLLTVLYLGEDELREAARENRLADRGRHPTERSVLEVLDAAERPLRQKEVYERMAPALRPSPARVGQILRELFRDRYLLRQLGRARGRSEVAHYHLSPRGRELCQQVGVKQAAVASVHERPAVTAPTRAPIQPPKSNKTSTVAALARACIDPDWMLRRVASGFFQSTPDRKFARSFLTRLCDASPSEDSLADSGARGALKNELAKEFNLLDVAADHDVFNDVHLITAH